MSEPGRERGRDRVERLRRPLAVMEAACSLLPRPVARRILAASRRPGVGARALRFALLRSVAGGCGELVDIRGGVYLFGVDGLVLGSRVSIHPMCYLDASGGITIGDDVSIAHGVSILSTEHQFTGADLPIRDQPLEFQPVFIDDNVWIGCGARILSGVRIGSGSVVAAGAVVVRNVSPGSVVGGVPARVLRTRTFSATESPTPECEIPESGIPESGNRQAGNREADNRESGIPESGTPELRAWTSDGMGR